MSDRNKFSYFNLQVTLMLSTKFQVNWPFGWGEEKKNRFSRWRPWRLRIGKILAIFSLQDTLMLPSKFQVSWPFGSGEEAKWNFKIAAIAAILDCGSEIFKLFLLYKTSQPLLPSWISDWKNLSYVWPTSHPNASYQVSSQLAFRFRRRSEKNIFKMAATAAILDFRSQRFSLFFFLSVLDFRSEQF